MLQCGPPDQPFAADAKSSRPRTGSVRDKGLVRCNRAFLCIVSYSRPSLRRHTNRTRSLTIGETNDSTLDRQHGTRFDANRQNRPVPGSTVKARYETGFQNAVAYIRGPWFKSPSRLVRADPAQPENCLRIEAKPRLIRHSQTVA